VSIVQTNTQSMTADELRTSFLSFFETRQHTLIKSDCLVPANDPTLLFTGAGMNQFKEQFLGKNVKWRRAVSCQKCLRTPDIERVGKTSAHHTFFEMLGNFSFGDYFKKEAIKWAWEYLVDILRLPEDRLFASVYEDDEEAAAAWLSDIGLPSERLYRFGADENFWPANAPAEGPNGPCGPCSEIFYDQGPDVGCRRSDCNPSCDCDRFVEIWNLVFTQYDRSDGGTLKPLPQKNIDTGMGLERLTAVMQGARTNFDTDLFMPIITETSRLLGVAYERDKDSGRHFRKISDHIRAVVFCLADGVLPSNEKRGYVVRRLIRRALGAGIRIGARDSFLHRLVPVVARVMRRPYPEFEERQADIARIVSVEEERFLATIEQGSRMLEEMVAGMKQDKVTQLRGGDAFRLYDTYGFPLDLTEDMLSDQGMTVDRAGFEEEMSKQRELARSASNIVADIFVHGPLSAVKEKITPTEFVGYDTLVAPGTVKAILVGDHLSDHADAGDGNVAVVLDRSPFYGEAGGQVGDTGRLEAPAAALRVDDTKREDGYFLHIGEVVQGTLKVGQQVTSSVEADRRLLISINHTATHLLHHALRQVLGEHAEQKGSLVAPDRLRFDFMHPSSLTPDEIDAIERLVNRLVISGGATETAEMSYDNARRAGAIALFGEKYGDTVRLVNIGGFSKELCGGTHLDFLGPIGLFKIVSEEAIGAGIRRITAVTAYTAFEAFKQREQVLRDISAHLRCSWDETASRVAALQEQMKTLRKDLTKAKSQSLADSSDKLLDAAQQIGSIKLVTAKLDVASVDELRTGADQLVKKEPSAVVVMALSADGKVQAVVAVGKAAQQEGLKAGDIAKELASTLGGGGGGKPHMAQAGGTKIEKLDEALQQVAGIVRQKTAH